MGRGLDGGGGGSRGPGGRGARVPPALFRFVFCLLSEEIPASCRVGLV